MNNDAVYTTSPETGKKVSSLLSREEIRHFTARSDLVGAWAIGSTWLLIAGYFSLIAWSLTQPLWLAMTGAIIGVALIGGRQLALAIITHEATHKTLFKTKWANTALADWLCARPIGLDLEKYRAHHFIHHTRTGTDEDSDISLIEGLPCSRRSLIRKFARDLTGVTGAKFLLGRVLMDAERLKWTVATDITWLPRKHFCYHALALFRNSGPAVLTNALLFSVLFAVGHGYLYAFWVLAYLIPYPLFIRIRALAEHAGTERSTNMFKNTRTTRAGVIARTFVAPLHVNFHIEHHAMASVPWFRLPALHQRLRECNAVAQPPSYWAVMKWVSSANG